MAHMGMAHPYVGNILVYLHNKFNKNHKTYFGNIGIHNKAWITKLSEYLKLTHLLVPHAGPAKTIFLPWILSPDPHTNIEYPHSMVPQRYDVIHIYILWWLWWWWWWWWWWWFIYIYIIIIYIYICVCFFTPLYLHRGEWLTLGHLGQVKNHEATTDVMSKSQQAERTTDGMMENWVLSDDSGHH